MSDPFALAAEHAAWCLRESMTIEDVLRSIGDPVFGTETWNDAIWALAKAADDMKDPRLLRRRLVIYPPFRARQSPMARVKTPTRRVA